MREFIYFSSTAPTTGNFSTNLKEAGRIDIACHFLINAFFVSHAIRPDVKVHLIFYGKPDPPKHLEISINEKNKKFFSKKDVSGFIRRMLYKYKKGCKNEVFDSCFIEKKSFLEVIEELRKQGKQIYLLDPKGENIKQTKLEKDCVFIFGDHEGLPPKEIKKIKKIAKKISLGKITYFASQALTILQYELDSRF
ncbi:MAG: hypothetical protein NZ889_01835 [Candidatus Pacearchaeota archaeon]|nr:hypothetical protein [Candidatus Pacearchaeota archaeon]